MTRTEILVADWRDCRKFLYFMALTTIMLMLAVAWAKPAGLSAKLILLFSAIPSAPLIAWLCFGAHREPDRLKGLLGPTTRDLDVRHFNQIVL